MCGAQSSARSAGLAPPQGVLVSALGIAVKERTWFQWGLTSHGPEVRGSLHS